MHYLHYEEREKHGTDEFPLEFYSVDENHPKYNMPYHWHRETELLYIIRGEFRLSLNGREYRLKEGELCYIAGGVLHGGEPIACTYECIDFDINALLQHTHLMRKYLRQVESEHVQVYPLFTVAQPGIIKCASRMFTAARTHREGWELLVLAGLFDFFGTVVQQHYYSDLPAKKGGQQKGRQIKSAIEYIEGNYQKAVSLDDLAKAAGLSPKYFCRYFRMMTQRTPVDYLNYYRVERACHLLEQQRRSVTDVALDCGFNDISYFIRCFKKYKGTTPYRYVKSIRTMETQMAKLEKSEKK